MISVGLVDLDTTHARSFTVRLNALGDFRVTRIFDGRQVRTDEEVKVFCRDFDCAECGSVEELAQQVDAALVLSADWEVHWQRTRPLLEAGRPTYVDKPLAGSKGELEQFVAWAEKTGTPLMAGSGWRFAQAIQQAHDRYGEGVDNVLALMHRDFMYYGIHAVEMVLGLLGPGIEQVEMVMKEPGAQVIEFIHRGGAVGRLMLQLAQGCFWYGVRFTAEGKTVGVYFDAEQVHNGACGIFAQMVRRGKASLRPRDLIESPLVMMAGLQSWEQSRAVRLDEVPANARYDSGDFMKSYLAETAQRRKMEA